MDATPFVAEPRKPQRLPLVFFPDSKLQEVSRPISFETYALGVHREDTYLHPAEREAFAADLTLTMNLNGGVGLSAVQVGRPLRVFALKDGDRDLVLWNPVWGPTVTATKAPLQEGCLSFPGVFEEVERYDEVEVDYFDTEGKPHTETFKGVAAHVVQHETEHLDGHLFIEHLPIHKRDRIRQKMKQRARLTTRVNKVLRTDNLSLEDLQRFGLVQGRRS